jgi:hypothetical protein
MLRNRIQVEPSVLVEKLLHFFLGGFLQNLVKSEIPSCFFPKEVKISKAEKQMNEHPKYIVLFLVFLKSIAEPAARTGTLLWPPEHKHPIGKAKSRQMKDFSKIEIF